MTDDTASPAPLFDTKVVVVLADDLTAWQELNVTAFLASGIATSAPDLVGEPYRDADGTDYLPMLRQPVMVLTADAGLLGRARAKAAARDDIALAIYTRELFTTSHDAANRAAVAGVAAADLDLVGIAVRGPRNAVDRIVKGAVFHA
ncbi:MULTISPECIES: DUF2000 domain-containing protein [unclassified Microbacterium]|uniref:DUF2000 domain-containing protein n=1 Tax=unclassified Microbacterium TaxID=2609290 RepID=UPI0006F4EC82|nr:MULTISPECIES: DUF2000 domain-containing protein [unclassified Microbacterium]KQT74537.1 hypothetical protein ASG45_08190 [Microbacterium sp. Leaf436]MBD8207868.1 DUF2000 domain-containing protein [Microbacterium sp. CFBP 8801]MBD8510771.1 DUF2000 domain-containing protein [Microbacterium sp. CFBP 8790]